MKIKINFDGACHNVPGQNNVMGIGVAIFIDDVYNEEYSYAEHYNPQNIRGTNNIAEWRGCVLALQFASTFRESYPNALISVFSDSQLIVNQYNGGYRIKDQTFVQFCEEARSYGQLAKVPVIEWVPRELNKEADKLSKIGRLTLGPENQFGQIKSTKHKTKPYDTSAK